ncbi:alpha/beta hydrolase [Kitasatospora sp. NPDC052896]|uniref:alpha/beta hydrolase n=1 Tax=Kitasatospora sp. NPDC052896 TaxID=3364061 RepID=UPI0037C671DB
MARVSRRILPAALGVTMVAGCGGAAGSRGAEVVNSARPSTSSSAAASSGAADPALEPFYGQQIAWATCPDDPTRKGVDEADFQCATLHVPLDYTHPGGDTVDIAVVRRPAAQPGQRLGALVVDPGGPGGSGIQEVTLDGKQFSGLTDRYDLVGFDPRGVGKSTAVHCLGDQARDQWDTDDHPAQPKGTTLAQACQANSGKLLPFVGTADAARDMDVLRGALGDPRLNYLGSSYGTYLGSVYAEEFPDRTGRLVLDGAMDPSMDLLDQDVQQTIAFEGVFERFAKDCTTQARCPLGKDPAGAAQRLGDFLDGLDARPMTATDGRKLTASQGWTGTLGMLYGDAKSWEYLRDGLDWAMNGNKADYLLEFADDYNGRDTGGHYSNELDAYAAITCADHSGEGIPSDGRVQQAVQQLHEQAPLLTKHYTTDDLFDPDCRNWPFKSTAQPHAIRAAGSAPILVVGSTGDDATPYAWAQKLASGLANATLLTRDGDGHTGYGKSACIQTDVNAFLLDGTMPPAGTHCPTS